MEDRGRFCVLDGNVWKTTKSYEKTEFLPPICFEDIEPSPVFFCLFPKSYGTGEPSPCPRQRPRHRTVPCLSNAQESTVHIYSSIFIQCMTRLYMPSCINRYKKQEFATEFTAFFNKVYKILTFTQISGHHVI